jgi:hypothetical protein
MEATEEVAVGPDLPPSGARPRSRSKSPLVERDKRCFSSSVLIGLAFAGLAMWFSVSLYARFYQHRLLGHHAWYTTSDIWQIVDGGRFVWNGALANVYDGASSAYALPLSFILMAPVSAVIDHFHLVEGLFPLARPNAWLLVGPYSLLFGIFLLDAVRRLAWDLGQHRLLWVSQLLAVGLVLVPGFEWGHFEDVLALTFVIHAARLVVAKDHVRAALLLSLAVSSKQWALFLIPLVVLMAPRGRRLKCLAASCALPVLFLLILLVFGGKTAFNALFSPINLGRTAPGHISFYVTWFGSRTSQMSRTLGVAVGLIVAWKLRRVSTNAQILAAMSILVLIRPFSEAINYSYYWSPSLVLAGFVGVAAHGRIRVRDWMWQLAAIAWTLPHGNPATYSWWWAGMMVLLTCTWVQVAWNCGLSFHYLADRRHLSELTAAPAWDGTAASTHQSAAPESEAIPSTAGPL